MVVADGCEVRRVVGDLLAARLLQLLHAPAAVNTLDFFLAFSRPVWLFLDQAVTWDQHARDG
ncbi:MAG: hypothetical protein O6913_07190 [Chloroflexi bacterium]|nr:hypothetical protein [Chloroflexota bacterium]